MNSSVQVESVVIAGLLEVRLTGRAKHGQGEAFVCLFPMGDAAGEDLRGVFAGVSSGWGRQEDPRLRHRDGLDHVGEPTPPVAPARGPPECEEFFDQSPAYDPSQGEPDLGFEFD